MSELKGFPFKLQEHSPTMDGEPDENKDWNCVQTCIAAGLQYFTGKEYEPDEVKDATYGQGYVGCTSAVNDVVYCAHQGVHLSPVSGSPAYLVSQAHSHLAQGHVVLGTIPIPYNPPADRMNPGMSHVIAFYKDSPGVLIAMNPLQAIAQAQVEQWWMDRLCFEQIWIMEKSVNNSIQVPLGWKDNGKELVAPNGKKVVLGFRLWVLAHNWNPGNVPVEDEVGEGGGTVQNFMGTVLRWNKVRGVYEDWIGPELVEALHNLDLCAQHAKDIQAQLTQALADQKALQAEVDALKAKPATNPDLVKNLTSIADSIQNVIDSIPQ